MNEIINKILSKNNENDIINYLNTQDILLLKNLILELNKKYYTGSGESYLDDWRYDIIKEHIETKDPKFLEGKVGNSEIDIPGKKVELPVWMGSMNKYKDKDFEKIRSWVNKFRSQEYIIEEKLDGISCLLVKNKNNPKIYLYTRGDGKIGTDISRFGNYIFNSSFDKLAKIDFDIMVRGELIMKKEIFEKKYQDKFANARNMVAGKISKYEIDDSIKDIDFIAYELLNLNPKTNIQYKPTEQLDTMKNFFKIVKSRILTIDLFNLVKNLDDQLEEFRKNSKYTIDGIIIQPNLAYKRNLSGNPEYAWAYKNNLSINIKQATVNDVIWNITKRGYIKPVILIEPIKLMGVIIKKVTGFNAKFIEENSIGPGAIIEITRSGDVIPHIVGIIKNSPSGSKFPNIDWKWNNTKIDIMLKNFQDSDSSMCKKLVEDFFKKTKIKNFGPQTIKKLFDAGYNSLISILKMKQNDFLELEGIKQQGAYRLWNSIQEEIKHIKLPNLIAASNSLGSGIGEQKIKLLFDSYPNILTEFSKKSEKKLKQDLLNIKGFSDITVDQIISYLPIARDFVQQFNKIFKISLTEQKKENIKTKKNNNLNNITIVFSGFRDSELKIQIENNGGKVTTQVSNNTNILIVPDGDIKETTKIINAREKGIEIIGKTNFKKKYL